MDVKSWLTRYKGWPLWARIGAPAFLVMLVIGLLAPSEDQGARAKKLTTTTLEVEALTIAEATELVLDVEGTGLSKSQATGLVRATCSAAGERDGADELAERLVDLEVKRTRLRPLLTALGEAAEGYCADDVSEAPDLLNDAYAAALLLFHATTTTTTQATTTTTVPVTTTTKAPPPTTRPPSTTQAPAPPPPPPPPPTTQPPSGGGTVHPGAFCSPVGATGYSSGGVPMTCATHKCDGTPYDQPRWRKTNC